MSLRHLTPIRRVIAASLLVALTVLVLDAGNLVPRIVVAVVTAFQLVPALTKSIVSPGFWTVLAVLVLAVTLLFGRVYCSTLCPLGTLQDLFIRLGKKRRPKRWFEYRKPHYALHYLLLAASAGTAAAGSMLVVNLFEPFSNFGRMVQGVLRPLVLVVNNGLARLLGGFDIYWVHDIPLPGMTLGVVLIPLAFGVFLGWLSYTRGRLFCNLLCPAGALLGLLSRWSLWKIVIEEENCRDCGLCEMVCKAQCIDAKRKLVDYGACVSCFNCLRACPTVGMKYVGRYSSEGESPLEAFDEGRRAVLKSIPVLALIPVKQDSSALTRPPRQLHPVTPPGSIGLERFSQLCTACHLCISACPTQVLVPSLFEYGLSGLFQPKMDYGVSFCNYDCTVCTAICPTGAILPLASEEKKLVQMGKAKFVKDDCIVVTKKADCGACSEHCPTKAVHMVPYERLLLPEVKEELCIGCGACEHSCPTKPLKAIYVEANVVHRRAEKPPVKKLEPEPVPAEFPF
jgi:ferredoxin